MYRHSPILVLLSLLVVACARQPGEYNVRMNCKTAAGQGLEVVRDLAEIGWCTVRGRLPLRVTLLSETEANAVWRLPDPPEEPTPVHPEPALRATGDDPLWPRQWGPRAVKAPEVWQEITRGDPGVVVAILDTGYDGDHPDLPSLADCANVVENSLNCTDRHGHGTHVAGIIAMQVNDVGGVGMAAHVSLVAVKVIGDDGQGDVAGIARGIILAQQMGAQIINMSLGGPATSNVIGDAIDYVTRRGVLVVAACGNSGMDPAFGDLCLEPARRDNVLGVGAVDEALVPAYWNNRRPDLVAPGVAVVSTLPGEKYASWSGTSMAAPHAAAAAALYASEMDNWTPGDLMAAIAGTTTQIAGCPEERCGAGLINAWQLLTEVPRPTVTPRLPTPYPSPRTVTPQPTPTMTPSPTPTPTPARADRAWLELIMRNWPRRLPLVFGVVNGYRELRQLPPLAWSTKLERAATLVAGDGTYCPQDKEMIEVRLSRALSTVGYRDRRGWALVLCGEYPDEMVVLDYLRDFGGPSHPDLEEVGAVHLAELEFARGASSDEATGGGGWDYQAVGGRKVTDIWVVIAGQPVK